MKAQKDAAKVAFDSATLAQFLFGPGWRQAGAVLLTFRIPGDDGDRMDSRMDPGAKS